MGLRRFGGPGMHGIGGVPLSSMGGGALKAYVDKVKGYGPIAYWPLWEASGTAAQCLVNPLQNGIYNSDVATWPPQTGMGDGNTAPYFDGTNDLINVNTATFAAALNGTTGTAMIWAKVVNAGIWTDAAAHWTFLFRDGAYANLIGITKPTANNTVTFYYRAGGVDDSFIYNPISSTAWMCLAWVWDKTGANATLAYVNGGYVGGSAGLGVWAGGLGTYVIGSETTAGANRWHGWLAHLAIWNRALTAPEIASLAAP